VNGLGARPLTFADANAPLKGAEFVLVGVPFDATSSFRPGAKFAPNAIREASWNFETFNLEHRTDLADMKIHDSGNLEDFALPDDMVREVRSAVEGILENGSFPIVLGGEHSLLPGVVAALKERLDFGVIVLDAHMDFRDEYLNVRSSHACATRRSADVVGAEAIVPIGVRSVSREEIEEIEKDFKDRFHYIDAFEVKRIGMDAAVKRALKWIGRKHIYLSLDMDALDPAYAPGTGTPEPFGLTTWDLREAVRILAHRLVGFDIVEIAPNYDNGNTAALGARIIREVIAAVHKARAGK
jgi:agmatinase